MADSHRAYFNQLAAVWPTAAQDETALISYLREFGLDAHDRVLDVGAGIGIMTRLMREHGPAGICIVPVDLSEKMLIKGKHSPALDFSNATCTDIHHSAFRSCQFDKVLCFSVFPHITHPARAAQELFRLLKPGGRLLVLHSQCSRKLNAFHASLSGPVIHDELMPAFDLEKLLVRLGFQSKKVLENPLLYWVEVEKPKS